MLSVTNHNKRVFWKQVLFSSDKPVIGIIMTLLLLSLGMGLLTVLPFPKDLYEIMNRIQLALFFALGCWHVDVRKSRLFPLMRNGIDGRLFFTCLIALMLFVLLSVVYLILDRGDISIAAGSAAAFLLPWLVMEQWEQLNAVRENRFAPWRLPAREQKKVQPADDSRQALRFRLALNYFDPEDLMITVSVSPELPLGSAFLQALDQPDENHIELTEQQKGEYHWEFFRENLRIGRKRFLDPEKTLAENTINANTIITARRVKP